MTKLFKNSRNALAFVLAFAVLAVSLFTGVAINTEAADCGGELNVVYVNSNEPDGSFMDVAAGTAVGDGSKENPFVISTYSHLRYIAQSATYDNSYGKYFEFDDSIDVFVLQRESYIEGIGGLDAFLALDAAGVQNNFETNTSNLIQLQGNPNDTDGFAGILDGNGVHIVGGYTANGSGIINEVCEGATAKNLTVSHCYIASRWYSGSIFGRAVAHKATKTAPGSVCYENIVIHDNYQKTLENGWSQTGVLLGTTASGIAVKFSGLLVYGNISKGETASGSGIFNDCGLVGGYNSGWNGDEVNYPNGSYSNSIILDCAPYQVANQTNQATKAPYWSKVYTDTVADFTPSTFQKDWSLYDITVIDKSDITGANAVSTMANLDWSNIWIPTTDGMPELRSMHNIVADEHQEKCSSCGLVSPILSDCVYNDDRVCTICGKALNCDEKVIYWNGTATAPASTAEGTEEDPIIIKTAEELNYIATKDSKANGKWYKLDNSISAIVLQPESVVDAEYLMGLTNANDVKTYLTGLDGVIPWISGNDEWYFNGNFDGNGVEIYGLYTTGTNMAGLFRGIDPWFDTAGNASYDIESNSSTITCYYDTGFDEPMTIKGIALKNSYLSSERRMGGIIAMSASSKYGPRYTGAINIDSCVVANCYMESSKANYAPEQGILLGAVNADLYNINNCLVYGNAATNGAGNAMTLFPQAGTFYSTTIGMESSGAFIKSESAELIENSVTNTIVFGAAPYAIYSGNNRSCGTAVFENVYTDAPAGTVEFSFGTITYADTDIKNVSGLTGAELATACENLDWDGTWLVTAAEPTLRSFHDNTFTTVDNGNGTHSVACSCGLEISAEENHVWNGDQTCDMCGATCTHTLNGAPTIAPVETSKPTCTEPGKVDAVCSICGFVAATGVPGDPALGHNNVLVPGTPATCTEPGAKEYYECDREGCDALFENQVGTIAIAAEDLETWKVIDPLGHVATEDDKGGTVYATHDGWHYMVCDREGCGAEFNGEACDGDYVADGANGCSGICNTCGVETVAGAEHAFNENYECSRCGWSCEDNHTAGEAVQEKIVEKTCTEDGSYDSVVYCSVCGYEMSRETVTEEAGHSVPYTWTENPVPACLTDGSYDTVGTCTVCEEEIRTTTVVPKQGHIFSTIPASDPTCTGTGNVEYKTCYECCNDFAADEEDIYSENYITAEDYEIAIDPEAHTFEEHEAVAADCENNGMLAYKQCIECNYAVSEDGEVEAIIEVDEEAFNAAYAEQIKPMWMEFYNTMYETQEEWIAAQEAIWDAEEALRAEYVEAAAVAAGFGVEASHELVKVGEVPATYEAEGTKAHYACEVCDKLFADAEGTEEVTAEELVIAKLVKEEEKPSTEDKKDDTSDKKDDTTKNENADKSPESPKTGETVATLAAAVVAVIAAGFVLVRKSIKA